MEHAFGSPRKSVAFYEADDSGLFAKPLPGSTTKDEDRIFYTIHKMVNTYLQGNSLTGMTTRFQANLARMVEESEVGDEWIEVPDFYAFLQMQTLEAAVRSIFGDYILSLNPTFAQDFWTFDRGMRDLFMQTPRWMQPGIFRARDRMLENVTRWHKYALEHYDIENAEKDDVDWEPYLGSKFGRVRVATFMKFKALDETARAAEDMGLLWA
jgi:hypothetical protein